MFKVNENMNTMYKTYLDHFQKMSQHYVESFWAPFLAKVKKTEMTQKKRKNKKSSSIRSTRITKKDQEKIMFH
ncbi:MAG TPA: hypothetical protein VFY68_14870 [Nitrososphaeraceae archaeon]|nr:hypothetical protein [Nitrososphaeraceae archaeon]